MRTFKRVLTVTGVAAASLSMAGLASAVTPVTLSKGHVDVLDVEYASGVLDLHVHDESVTPDVEYSPADVVLQALPASAYTVPSGSCYSFLGTAGSTVYRLPEVQNSNLLWPGISGEHLATGVFQNDRVQAQLVAVSGPGKFSVYKNGLCPGSTKSFDSGDGISAADSKNVAAGEHSHANWAFSATGTYTLTFKVTGTLTNGTVVNSANVNYTFKVGA
ncbi:choice-of-anchor M domain-containing protein [Streptomyces sp. APSN-46.1]|uniref:choice-of-anchor M domain-containing protein n=1 Tax=Streptomyces sp. APSN-46.1 TaxID=2929049 RepID=UPI001FB22DD3|nr:choice-of-anchor M domain-containing protein [Streptomyces sp. APSN-46.1]MCJ1680405.1 choice-of-anchor M domain-containing protein [Streptomyces sp. APSN-46.1]